VIVADTNLVAYTVIPGPHDLAVQRVRAADDDWVAPRLLRSELLNVIARNMAHGKMDRDKALKTFRRGMSMVRLGRDPDPIGVCNLCRSAGCTSYDGEFIWLAQELGVPLVTADAKVLAAFPDTAVSFEAFVGLR
jgi:predicted nucleic acid-binding protein